MTASQAPRAIYPPLELGLGWVKFVPTHVGKQVSGIGLVSPMRVIHFFRAVGVPPDGQFRLVCRHLSSRRSAISYYDSRASTPCPPHPNFRSLHHLRRIHRPPSISSSLSIVLSFLSQPSQAFLCCPHAISFFPHHPWAVTPFSVCSATWLLRCRWQHPR